MHQAFYLTLAHCFFTGSSKRCRCETAARRPVSSSVSVFAIVAVDDDNIVDGFRLSLQPAPNFSWGNFVCLYLTMRDSWFKGQEIVVSHVNIVAGSSARSDSNYTRLSSGCKGRLLVFVWCWSWEKVLQFYDTSCLSVNKGWAWRQKLLSVNDIT